MHELNKDIPLLKLITFDEGETAELTKEEIDELLTYCWAIGVGHKLLNQTFIQEMNNEGLHVYATDVQEAECCKGYEENWGERNFY